MEVRIKFDADIVITGDTMQDVREKFESMELWSQEAKDCHVEFSEIQLIEDADTYKDLADEYNSCYNNNKDDDEEDDAWYNDEWDEDDDDNWIECCPQCNHQFAQCEHNYNDKTHHLDYKCPKCGWTGNEKEISYVR